MVWVGLRIKVFVGLTTALNRDLVDADNYVELLAMVFGHRADQITATTRAALDARDVIKRAQNNGG
jgi:hypothetical protein